MAGKPVELKFVADVAQFLRETKKVEISTEDLADALVAASNDSADLEKKMSRAMRDAEKDVDRLERAVKGVGDAADTAGDEAKRGFGKVGDAAGEAGREAGDEFRQNLGETLASGGGLADIVGDTIGGLTASMGGIATVVGAGALLVFNRVKGQIEDFNKDIADQATSMWGTAIDSVVGKIGEATIQISNAQLAQEELSRLWHESPDDMKKLVDQAELLGINTNDVLLARAGDEAAIKRVNEQLGESERLTENYAGMTSDNIIAHDNIKKSIDKGNESLTIANAQMSAFNQSTEDGAAAVDIIRQRIDAWRHGIQMTNEEFATLAAGLDALPTEKQVELNVTLTSSGEANLRRFEQLNPYGNVQGGYKVKYKDPNQGTSY